MRLFVLLSRVPYPLDKGDKLRAFHQLKHLSKNHEISLCCLADQSLDPRAKEELKKVCSELNIIPLNRFGILFRLIWALFSNLPFQVHYFYQIGAARRIRNIIREFKPEHIYCQLIRTAEYVKEEFNIPKTIDYMDALSTGMQRRINESPWYLKPLIRQEARKLLSYENTIFDYFENKSIISKQDRELIYHKEREQIKIIPNGVDTDFFHPIDQNPIKYDLVFNGNMSYSPNINCSAYIVREIFPLLKKDRPDTSLLISGTHPPAEIRKLSGKGVSISGWVDDIRNSYASGKIFLAPMQIGTGLQNKLLEAMAMGIPCITSKLANEALGGTHGENILVCERPEEYARAILDLLKNDDLRRRLGMEGRTFISKRYDWNQSNARLEELICSGGPV